MADLIQIQIDVSRKLLVIMGSACAIVAGGVLLLLLNSHDSEVLVAPAANLTTEWTELRPQSSMRTSGDRSELYVEVVNTRQETGDTYAFEDGSKMLMEAYLTTKSGERLDLGVDMYLGRFGLTKVIHLSSPVLDWKRSNYTFESLDLRANRPLQVGRVVWISYDPQSTKSGIKTPNAFLKD